MTINKVAQYINTHEPDLKQFWADYKDGVLDYRAILSEPVELALFKFELITLDISHKRKHRWTSTPYFFRHPDQALLDFELKHNVSIITKDIHYNSYILTELLFTFQDLIIKSVNNPTKYLNTYLKGKLRSAKGINSGSTKLSVSIADNLMSYTLFAQSLEGKSLNSVQVEGILDQIQTYSEVLRKQYFDLVLSKCPYPSIKLTKLISENSPWFAYVTLLNPYHIRYSAGYQNVAFMKEFQEDLDSYYDPFVAEIPKKPTNKQKLLARYLQSALVLMSSSTPEDSKLANSLIEYINLPEHKVFKENFISDLNAHKDNIETLIGKLNG